MPVIHLCNVTAFFVVFWVTRVVILMQQQFLDLTYKIIQQFNKVLSVLFLVGKNEDDYTMKLFAIV